MKICRLLTVFLWITLFSLWGEAQEIRLKTTKKVGSKVILTLYAEENITLSGVKEVATNSDTPQEYTLEKQEIVISGNLQHMRVCNAELTELTLQRCIALEEIDCSQNLLTELDLTEAPFLKKLSCFANQLTRLELSSCRLLRQVKCTNNQLSTLAVGHLTKLEELSCSQNTISQLDLSKMNQLKALKCYQNQLQSLDLSACSTLEKLWCSENRLEALDLSHNESLKVIWCYSNKLSAISFCNSPNLLWLHCENNQLTTLDCGSMPKMSKLSIYGNQIHGDDMKALINSLPQRMSDTKGTFLVVDTKNSYEKNICTTEEVALAITKGWQVLDYCGGANDHQGVQYDGKPSKAEEKVSASKIIIWWSPQGLYVSPIKKGDVARAYDPAGRLVGEAVCTSDNTLLFNIVFPEEQEVLVITLNDIYVGKIIKGQN